MAVWLIIIMDIAHISKNITENTSIAAPKDSSIERKSNNFNSDFRNFSNILNSQRQVMS